MIKLLKGDCLIESDKIESGSVDLILTDLPYGKNTKDIDKDLYKDFFKILEKYLKKRAVIMLPKWHKLKTKLKVKHHFSIYVHKSMSKEIYVLEK